ncbi:MAG: Ser-Thr-rich GPI-anchored membrane family protein [Bacteroidota bacterium]
MKKLILSLLIALLSIPAFSSSLVTVVSPNGGENWTIGCPYAITWISSNTAGALKIELYKDNAFCMTICSQVPASMTSYTWIPPVSLIPASTYKVKISLLASSATGYDFSDGNFSINGGTLTVVSPNGGEVWQKASTHLITWTGNICDNVRIELWKGGVFNLLITPSTPSNGSFTWAIPAATVSGNDYKIKIMSVNTVAGTTSTVFDFSDANFSIGTTPLTVISPNGGEMWYVGGTYPITWIDATAEYVRIELWKGGALNSVICNSTAGPFNWVIPATVGTGNDYKIKVIGLSSSASYDFSDNNFSILQGSFIIVTSPNGGETWLKGTTRIITWLDNITWNVRIELWKGGAYYSLINASTPSTGSCYWAIPATLPSGNDYKVRVLAVSNTGSAPLSDFSDNNFTINGPNPTPVGTTFGSIKVFPNPGSNLLHVQFGEWSETGIELEIVDFVGNRMLNQPVAEVKGNETVDLNSSTLPDGNYIIMVKKDNSIIYRNNLLIRH